MNSKQTLKSLLLGLAAVALSVTSCTKTDTPSESSQPAQSDSKSESKQESSSVVESSSVEESKHAESSSKVESSSVEESSPAESSSVEESSPAESSSVEESSPADEPTPEATVYDDFTFNYAAENMTVWTNEEINNSVAPVAPGKSGQDVSEYHTTGVHGDAGYGYYTFVIDADGFIEYASYGTGAGWGSPCDGYYYNQTTKDRTNAEYFILHDEYADWPNVTSSGESAWTLYDFIIPKGGFVITGWHADEEFTNFWKQIFGDDASPRLSNVYTATNNSFIENSVAPRSLDNLYVSLAEDKTIQVRERTATELKDEDGLVEDATPAINYTPTADDAVINYETISDVLTACAAETIDTDDHIVKGVITSFYADGTLVIEDENGNAITVYGYDSLGTVADAKYQVGQTISVTGKLAAFKGLYEIKPNSADDVKVIDAYGKIAMPEATEVDADNVDDIITVANQGKLVKLIKAKVTAINEKGSSTVELGDTTVTLFKVDFPDTVQVGDYIDVTGSISVYNSAQLRVDSSAAIARYYTITAEIDGNIETQGAAKGETVSLTATTKEGYIFAKWVKVVGEEEIEISTSSDIDVEVDGDATYKAVYTYAPWTSLDEDYAQVGTITISTVNSDAAAGDAVSITTDADAKFHTNGAWNEGYYGAAGLWRSYAVFDADGKVAYAVQTPTNGYGGPNATSYITVYEDYTTNPAFNILDGYGPWTQEDASASKKFEIVVPKGGFVLVSHGTGSDQIINALLGTSGLTWTKDYNKRIDVSTVRAYYDSTEGIVRVFNDVVGEDDLKVTIDNDQTTTYAAGTVLYNSEGWAYGAWANYMIVDADGVIAYNVWNAGCGYGGGLGTIYANSKYANDENPCFVDGTVVVPEGFTGIKFGYTIVNNVYSKLTGTQITHSYLDEVGGWSTLAYAWNSVNNPFILQAARVNVYDGFLVVNNGGLQDKETVNVKSLVEANTVIEANPKEGEDPITLGDVTIALDQWNRVIFASYTHDGYGGPADGFYHDGSYACVAGETHGIFALDENFAPWPATVGEGEDNVNAWSLYSVVVPSNGKIITGSVDTMLPLVNKIFGVNLTTITDNSFFENTLADSAYNHVLVNCDKDDVELVTKYVDVQGVTLIDSAEDLAAANLADVYLVGVNAKGVVIYASHFGGAGYGGPADGFYHDGNYLLTAGQVCGIFDVDSDFAAWPATVQRGEETVNAWSLYSVVVPEGGYLIAGSAADMLPVINSIFGLEETSLPSDNSLLEGIVDGSINGNKYVTYESIEQVGYSCSFTNANGNVDLAWNDVTGKWEGTCHLAKWTNYALEYVSEEGQAAITVWYDNTTISGDIVTEAEANNPGDKWTGGLFVDDANALAAHKWMNSNDGGKDYYVVYDPTANTLTVTKA